METSNELLQEKEQSISSARCCWWWAMVSSRVSLAMFKCTLVTFKMGCGFWSCQRHVLLAFLKWLLKWIWCPAFDPVPLLPKKQCSESWPADEPGAYAHLGPPCTTLFEHELQRLRSPFIFYIPQLFPPPHFCCLFLMHHWVSVQPPFTHILFFCCKKATRWEVKLKGLTVPASHWHTPFLYVKN